MARPSGTSRITAKGTQPGHAPLHAHGQEDVGHYKPSRPLVGWSVLVLLLAGIFVLVANYLSWIPGSPSSGLIVIGLLILLVGILLATRWR